MPVWAVTTYVVVLFVSRKYSTDDVAHYLYTRGVNKLYWKIDNDFRKLTS